MRQVDACEHVDEIIESFRAENVTVEVDFTEAPRYVRNSKNLDPAIKYKLPSSFSSFPSPYPLRLDPQI